MNEQAREHDRKHRQSQMQQRESQEDVKKQEGYYALGSAGDADAVAASGLAAWTRAR